MEPLTSLVILGLSGGTGVGAAKTLLEKLLGPSIETVGQALVPTSLRVWKEQRLHRAQQTLDQAANMMADARIEPLPVPGRVLMPILEHSSLEEDEGLRRRWAMLLANAAASIESIPPAFPQILSEMSPLDAKILQFVFEENINTGRHPTMVNWKQVVDGIGLETPYASIPPGGGALFSNNTSLGASMFNLVRLQLIVTGATQHYMLSDDILLRSELQLTPFGFMFSRAVNKLESAG